MKRKLNHLFWILPLGFLLRLYHLGSRSFWYDEAISMLAVRDFNLENIRNYGAFFTDAPLFYAFLKGWSFFGEGEFFLRILPMFFGCLSIIAVYYLAKLLFDPKTAIISSFILAVVPFHIYYSQELRVYTMVAFLALISMYYFVGLTKKSSLGNSIGYIVSTVLVLLSHHFAVCLLVGQLVSSFILGYRNKFFLKRSLVSQALIVLFVSTVYFSL
ncbi:MAG: glycosyltransferase family 39 protein, partial [Candidatus Omnitrophica bacterium]|nr:glycosyltransferase family 39 protein [Candidatus Omnitrophota bacterium]